MLHIPKLKQIIKILLILDIINYLKRENVFARFTINWFLLYQLHYVLVVKR